MNTIKVLGTGPSLRKAIDNNEITHNSILIGVNDICKYIHVDYLLIVDNISTFGLDRLNTIKNSNPIALYSHLDEWAIHPKFKQINRGTKAPDLSTLDEPFNLPYHCDSVYSAVCLAYQMQAQNIIVYGADFYGHPLIKNKYNILQAYANLYAELQKRKVNLFVSSTESLLIKVLPLYKK